jgi:hypothetical protein
MARSRSATHPLHEIVEACTRELAFLQFAGLVREAGAIVEGHTATTIDDLESAVADQLLPGRNSAYDDLLDWRRRLKRLELLDRITAHEPQPMLGADPRRDNYLYQLWLFYELGDLLQRAGRLKSWQLGDMHMEFTWGSHGNEATYIVSHDRGLAHHWHNAPGVRPDLYIARANRDAIRDADGTLIWQAPGYILDAKYYKPCDSMRAPASPVKRMIADLQLTGERHGALLFAFQESTAGQEIEEDDQDLAIEAEQHVRARLPLYQVKPNRDTQSLIAGEARIAIWQVQPRTSANGTIHQTLAALLERVHVALRKRVDIVCHGFLPDVDTINPGNTQPAHCKNCGELLAFCPKPHISTQHIDRVCPRCDCLRSVQLCHIIGRGTYTAPPFVKRVLTREELLTSIRMLRGWLQTNVSPSDMSDPAEQARNTMLRTIGELTETYVKLTRADTAQTEYGLREWIFGDYWSDEREERGLPKEVRNMLISGEFVWLQFQLSTIEDWAACAVQYTRALEFEIHRRLYEPCGQQLVTKEGAPMQPHQFTIGSVIYLYRDRKKNTNWTTVLDMVARPSGIAEDTFRQLLDEIEMLRIDRNKVAHTQHVDALLARRIRETVLGQHRQPGLLYRLCTQLNAPQPSPS